MTPVELDSSEAGRTRTFAVAAALFLIWGLALWLYNSLFFKFCKFFALGPVSISWTLAAFHFAYISVAIPAVLFHRQFGYKLGLLFGLSVFGVGAFLLYLAIIQNSSLYFLGAVVVIGSCGAWIDTSLNPLAASAGNPATTVRRLNLAHAFNGVGLFAAYFTGLTVLGKDYMLSSGATAQFSARPYVLVGLGAILLAFLLEQVYLPAFASKGTRKTPQKADLRSEFHGFLTDRRFLVAAAALCAYCAVLTILWTANYRYLHVELPGHTAAIFERGWFWFVVGRLFGNVLMRWIDPVRLLQWSAGACMIAITITAFAGGMTGWVSLISASFFLSIAYPTVFATALSQNPQRMAIAAGLLAIAAGTGNALSSLGSSFALDAMQFTPRAVVFAALPFAAVILYFALKTHVASKTAAAAVAPLPV